MKWKEKVSLVSVWHNDGSNVLILEKKTLNNYDVLENLNYDIWRIYAEFLEGNPQESTLGSQKNMVHHKIPYIAKLKHLKTPYCTNNHKKNQELEGIELLPLPAYSTDLASSDYHLFRSMAHFFHGRNFENIDVVEVDLTEFFTSKLETDTIVG